MINDCYAYLWTLWSSGSSFTPFTLSTLYFESSQLISLPHIKLQMNASIIGLRFAHVQGKPTRCRTR